MATKQRDKKEVKEFLLQSLEEILANPDEKTSDRLKAIQMYGIEHGMFIEQKKFNIDIAGIIKHFSNGQLQQIASGGGIPARQLSDGKDDFIDVDPLEGLPSDLSSTPTHPDLHS